MTTPDFGTITATSTQWTTPEDAYLGNTRYVLAADAAEARRLLNWGSVVFRTRIDFADRGVYFGPWQEVAE